MRYVLLLLILSAGSTGFAQQILRAREPIAPAARKSRAFTYTVLMEMDATARRRALHAAPPDKQYELVKTHLFRMLERHRLALTSQQKLFIETTIRELQARDFVRRRPMDAASMMRAWRGDRLGRMYRKTDVKIIKRLFPDPLAEEIFSLQ